MVQIILIMEYVVIMHIQMLIEDCQAVHVFYNDTKLYLKDELCR